MIWKPGQSVGIFGGAFDPPHNGHVAILNTARPYFDHVVMMPCYEDDAKIRMNEIAKMNGEKVKHMMSDGHQRLSMCALAIGDTRLVSDFEIRNKIAGGTYVVLKALQQQFPGVRFVWIIGEDNADNISAWRNCDKLIREFSFFVFPRAGYKSKDVQWWKHEPHIWAGDSDPIPEMSSTAIRSIVSQYKSICREHFGFNRSVPPKVRSYILDQGLYA